MKSKSDKKNVLCGDIKKAAKTYSEKMANRIFLFVYGNQFFEVAFLRECFLHLTGVCAKKISARDFYSYAQRNILTTMQFDFDANRTFDLAKQKVDCLKQLPDIVTKQVLVVKDLQTITATYSVGLTNFTFTVGLMKKDELYYIPKTLRVKDKAFARNSDTQFIDFVFERERGADKYNKIAFQSGKSIPDEVKSLLSDELLANI